MNKKELLAFDKRKIQIMTILSKIRSMDVPATDFLIDRRAKIDDKDYFISYFFPKIINGSIYVISSKDSIILFEFISLLNKIKTE